jgi:hypothetical protein
MNELSYLWGDPGDWGLSWRLWLGGARYKFIDETVANIYFSKKENQDYYQNQYQILLEAMSAQIEPRAERKLYFLRIRLFTNRLKRFVLSKS